MVTQTTEFPLLWLGLAGGVVMTLALYLAEAFAPGLESWHRVVMLLAIVLVVASIGWRWGRREQRRPGA